MPTSNIELQEQPSVALAVIRRQVSPDQLSRVVPECCGAVWSVLRAQGTRGGRNIALYWDRAIRLEAGVEMPDTFAETDGVVRSATPAGLVASVSHHGPYNTLGDAHDAIWAWCKATGHSPVGPRWEIYGHWRSEWDTDPSQIQTTVGYLVVRDP